MPVTKPTLRGGKGADLSLLVQESNRLQHLGHLPAVGPGVHHHRPAYAAGDAASELQAGQAQLQCPPGQPGQRRRAPRLQPLADLPDLVKIPG